MADKSGLLVLNALSRAAAAGAPVPLFASRTGPGLFPSTTAGKAAAARCREEGLLEDEEMPAPHSPGTSPALGLLAPARTAHAACRITEKGLDYLLDQSSPRQVLEDFVRVLEERQSEVGELLHVASRIHAGIEGVRQSVERVLRQAAPADLKTVFRGYHAPEPAPAQAPAPAKAPAPDVARLLTDYLARWAATGAPDDCSLPELYRVAAAIIPGLSIGAFHDGLRTLAAENRVYLHPWTGPLYELPEPPYALLAGHLVAYYASLRP